MYVCLAVQACVALLEKMSAEKADLHHLAETGGDALPTLSSPASASFTQVSLALTEVLQMQVSGSSLSLHRISYWAVMLPFPPASVYLCM